MAITNKFKLLLAITAACLAPQANAGDSANVQSPGRPVKVAAIAIGFGGEWDAKMKLATEHLEAAGALGVDIACLPEEFAGMAAEPQDGRTTQAIGAIARKHNMYVVCPIREQAEDGKQYNTAVLLGRDGQIEGYYRKVFVFWGEDLCCGQEGVKTFDLDFGRVAMLTCFDANFDEVWQEAERKDVEMVLWPSAYGGGMPLNGYAMIHNYNVVAVGFGNIIDVFGRNIEQVQSPLPQQFVTTLDLDLTIVHVDFNTEKVERLLAEHGDEVERVTDVGGPENWYVLRATKPGVRVHDLCREYELETLREYRQRSREQINELRMAGKPVPVP